METRAEYVLVGGFVLSLLALLVVALLWLVQAQYNAQAARYDIYFEGSVAGLDEGSTVRYNGVPIGRVSDISLDPENLDRVRVSIAISPRIVIKSDATAQIEIQGLTGGAYVEIAGSNSDAPRLVAQEGQPYPVIAAQNSQFQQVINAAPELLEKLSDLTDRLNSVTDAKNRADLAQTLDNLRQVTGVAAAHKQDIGAMLGDMSASLSRFDQLLAQSQNLIAQLSRLADSLERDPTRLIYGDQQKGYTPK
jgi:phospholipid/cholesterol/gamma-HCH transport system substrate-binding protein